MDWTVNGVPQPRQAPHPDDWAGYTWHGTFTAAAGDVVTYSDQLTFRHNIGPGGSATVTIYGQHTFTDEPG